MPTIVNATAIEAVESVLTGDWTDYAALTDEEFEQAVMAHRTPGNPFSGCLC